MLKPWIKEEVFFETKRFFSHLEEHLAAAEDSIDLETYIFNDDELGRRIANQLKAAASRGVHVRVMVDGFGSPHWARDFLRPLLKAGVEARIYHPMPLSALSPYFEKHPSLTKFFKRISTMNERNHRKVCVVDRQKAWTGGMNISAAHMSWRDTGVFVEGSRVQDFLCAFGQAWQKAWSPRHAFHPKKRWRKFRRWIALNLVRLNSNYRARKIAYRDLLKKISTANHRVWVTNAYFVPPQRLRRALQAASRRNVDVKVLVPRKSDVFFIRWISSALYFGLLTAGVKIFEYLPAPLHAKTLLIDDWATVGTTNLNHRSIIHDLEVDVVLTAVKSTEALAHRFERDLKESKEVSITDWRQRSWRERIAGQILLFFRYWI
ncbi:MAG: phospholipase D-like domain-containing protein [Bdellovibrionota bacterium]